MAFGEVSRLVEQQAIEKQHQLETLLKDKINGSYSAAITVISFL